MRRTILFTILNSIVFTGSLCSQTKTSLSAKEAELLIEIKLSKDDLAVFKDQTRQKVEEFQQHIATIGNKEISMDRRNLAELEALKLFYKGSQIEISYRGSDGQITKISREIVQYLARLKSLTYTRVIVKFYEIAYISDFTRGPDGRYYSVATILQEFSGFTGDNLTYSDLTRKEIEIIVDLVEDPFFNERRWRIFLGNIKATETRGVTMP